VRTSELNAWWAVVSAVANAAMRVVFRVQVEGDRNVPAQGSAIIAFNHVSVIDGPAVGIAALAIGFFNSIMFPVIFSVTLEKSTASAGSTSGLLCMAIVGGALLPPLTGKIADLQGLQAGFFLPLCAYAVIAVIAFKASQVARGFR